MMVCRLRTTVCIPRRRSVSGGDGASSPKNRPPPETTVFLWRRCSVVSGRWSVSRDDGLSPEATERRPGKTGRLPRRRPVSRDDGKISRDDGPSSRDTDRRPETTEKLLETTEQRRQAETARAGWQRDLRTPAPPALPRSDIPAAACSLAGRGCRRIPSIRRASG